MKEFIINLIIDFLKIYIWLLATPFSLFGFWSDKLISGKIKKEMIILSAIIKKIFPVSLI